MHLEHRDDAAEESEDNAVEESGPGESSLSRKRKQSSKQPNGSKASTSGSTRKRGKSEGQTSTTSRRGKRKSPDEDEAEASGRPHRPKLYLFDEMEEMELNNEDRVIKNADVPERLLEFWRVLDSLPGRNNDVTKEAEWIYNKLTGPLVSEQERATVLSQVENILSMFHKEKLEVPFIGCYRKEKCLEFVDKDGYTDGDFDDPATKPKLQQFKDLWDVHFWDKKWLLLQKRKRELMETLQKKMDNARQSEKELLQELSTFLLEAETEHAVEDVNAKLRHYFTVDAPQQRFKRPTRRPVSTADRGLDKLVEGFGLSPEKLSDNLRGVKKHDVENPDAEPKEIASHFVGAAHSTPESALATGRHTACVKICLEPSIRAFVRDLYMDKCCITTRPTLTGASDISKIHPCASLQWLTEKPVSKLEEAQWLLIEKAEHEGLVETALSLPKDVDLQQLFEAAYLSEADTPIATSWNEQRKQVLQETLRTLVPAIEKELRTSLAAKCRRWIASKYAEQLWEIVSLAPYSRREAEEDCSSTRVLACCWDSARQDAIFIMLNNGGEIDDVVRAGYLGNRAYNEEQKRRHAEASARLSQFIITHKPDVCVVGASSIQSCLLLEVIRTTIEDISGLNSEYLPPGGIEVVHGNETIARVYSSKLPLGDQPEVVRHAVALGRLLLEPLAAISSLFGPDREILSLKLHPLQDHLSSEELYEAAEQVMVTITAQVGVDVNLAVVQPWLFGPLQFVPGLGRRKACTVRSAICSAGMLNYRTDLLSSDVMNKFVYTNCAASLRVRRTGNIAHEVMYCLDETRIHPESYTVATSLAQHALTKDSEDVDDLMLQTALEFVRHNSNFLKEIDLNEFLATLQDSNFQHGVETLRDIKYCLMRGGVEVRRKYEAPNEQVVLWVAGELSNTVTATVQESSKRGVTCSVGLGAQGLLQSEERYAEGSSLPCVIQSVNTEFMRLEFGPLPEEENIESDEYYKVDETYLTNLRQRKDDKPKLGVFKERDIQHPLFRNVSTATAAEELVNGESGSFVFLPSIRGPCYVSLLVKVVDGVNLRMDIWEGQKDALSPRDVLRLGKILKIQGEAFKDLDEVISRFVEPLVKFLREALAYRKYKSGTQEEIDEWLRTEKEANPTHIPYCLCVSRERPGELSLSYIRTDADPSHEYVSITSKGYKFKNRLFETPDTVIGYFQQHIDDVVVPFIPGATCYNCGEDGHMSRNCPAKGSGGGGGGRGCRSCGQEGHMARDCPTKPAGEGGGGGRACHCCGQEGHISRDCPDKASKQTCRSCNQEGHMSRECPNKPAGGGRACHSCGQEGHMSRDCPTKPAGGGGRACHSCGQEGHISRDCPSKPAGGGGGRACHSCGQEGHISRDCPTKPSTRTCRSCGQEGHIARDCPEKGSATCFSCGQSGHESYNCPNKTGVEDNTNNDNGWGNSGGGIDWGDDNNNNNNNNAAAADQDGGWGDDGNNKQDGDASGWGDDTVAVAATNNESTWGEVKAQDTQTTWGNGGGRKSGSCYSCGQEGHMSRDCPSKPPRKSGACYNCGEDGHMSRDCPTKPSGGRKPVTCYACQGEGHFSRDCPNKKENEVDNRESIDWGSNNDNNNNNNEQNDNGGWGDTGNQTTGDGGGDNKAAGEDGGNNDGDKNTASKDNAGTGWGDQSQTADVNTGSRGGRTGGKGACYSCGEDGHMSRDCPSKPPRKSRACYSCGDEGHISRDCPTKNAPPPQDTNQGTAETQDAGWGDTNAGKDSETANGGGDGGDGWWGGNAGEANGDGFNAVRGGGKKGGACYNCGQEGHISRECPTKTSRKCYSCDQDGHNARECPGKPCYRCNESGHLSRDCPVQGTENGDEKGEGERASTEKSYYGSGRGGSAKKPGNCFSCNEEGHISRDCPKRPRTNAYCFCCGQHGHTLRDCPIRGACFRCGQMGHSYKTCTGSSAAPPAGDANKTTDVAAPLVDDGNKSTTEPVLPAGNAEKPNDKELPQVEEVGDSLPDFIPF